MTQNEIIFYNIVKKNVTFCVDKKKKVDVSKCTSGRMGWNNENFLGKR